MNELNKTNKTLLEDKLQLKEDVDLNLLKFINSQIQKVNNENDLMTDALKELSDRVNDKEMPMNDAALLKMVEILSKKDNDIALGIMDLMKNNKNSGGKDKDPELPDNTPPEESGMTKQDVAEIKDLLKVLPKVKKSEF